MSRYLLLERRAIIVVYTITIEAISAVPKETLTTYSVANCKNNRNCKLVKHMMLELHIIIEEKTQAAHVFKSKGESARRGGAVYLCLVK